MHRDCDLAPGTIFAYGQTGCGKTHTMVGKAEPAELRGIIPNRCVIVIFFFQLLHLYCERDNFTCSFEHIFEYIKTTTAKEFLVRPDMLLSPATTARVTCVGSFLPCAGSVLLHGDLQRGDPRSAGHGRARQDGPPRRPREGRLRGRPDAGESSEEGSRSV